MDISEEIGNMTPKKFYEKIVHLLKSEGDIMENDRTRRTYVLAKGSARLSLSTYLVNGTSVLTILYWNKWSMCEHTIEFWDRPDDGEFSVVWKN